ncbi:MAG: Stk1 family PASTA domain-containing Ser/Thr kinase [Bacilli bacterium]|nr:Stk1 family PASTA domain-containing Ser/Thr kinase [Bacilli bacterium]
MIMKGQKISDRYQIIKSIGEGGMANVYLAYDTILDRNVAVKVLRGDLSSDEKFVRRFQREALSASSLNHPNIVEVYDVGDDNGQYYIVMEYIEGKHLKELIKKRGHLTITEVVDIMLQITDGMSIAHDSYIIHRDIKPQNIMILENGLVKITDFGIAMAMNATQLTQTNSVMGSVHYLPPEQANGKGATLQSDIYSMGILMYELLTGKLPYRGENAVEIALKHLKEAIPSIRELMPNIPNSIENIIKKATAKNIKNRYNDAREMHEDLLTCLDDSRKEEPLYEFKYSENNYEDTRMVKIIKDPVESKKKKEDNKEEVIAKQINPDELKKQNKLVIILASIFTGLVVIITSVVLLIPMISGGKEIKVPDVTNMSVTDAIDKLQDEGFEVLDEQQEVSSTEVKEGNIVKTNPAAGSKRTKGTSITLYVSVGDTKITIENYKDKNYLEVKGALEALGLNVIVEKQEVEENDNSEYKDGQIIEQSVAEGEKLSVGETITIYIPDIITEYPDFADGSYSMDEIQSFCDDHGIKLQVKEEITSEVAEGTIIRQSREAGSPVAEGATITIYVAKAAVEEDMDEDCTEESRALGLC